LHRRLVTPHTDRKGADLRHRARFSHAEPRLQPGGATDTEEPSRTALISFTAC
jgi:hypothetical protein